MLEELFTFPIVMIDGENEEKRIERSKGLGLDIDDDLEIVIGEAELPYFDFIGITDRWMPDQNSFDNAMTGKFNACYVVFANMGGFVVPWSKAKFKSKIREFEQTFIESTTQKKKIKGASLHSGLLPTVQRIELTPEKADALMKILAPEKKSDNQDKPEEDGKPD